MLLHIFELCEVVDIECAVKVVWECSCNPFLVRLYRANEEVVTTYRNMCAKGNHRSSVNKPSIMLIVATSRHFLIFFLPLMKIQLVRAC